jgi:uncharacterized membrane protein YoaK (UPF0700 family)
MTMTVSSTQGAQSPAAQPADMPSAEAPAADQPIRQHGLWRSLLADPRFGPLPGLLLVMTVVTGVVDAVSILALGRVFVANMTGNVVFVGFALAGAPGLSVASSLIALAAFLVGARAGGEIGARLGAHRGHLVRGSGAVQSVLVALALGIALIAGMTLGNGARYAITAVLAAAMGIQNATAQRLAVPELTTTVLTRTLAGLAGGGVSAVLRLRRLLSVAAMFLGALIGGLLALEVSVAAALGLALALSLATALTAHLLSSHPGDWPQP